LAVAAVARADREHFTIRAMDPAVVPISQARPAVGGFTLIELMLVVVIVAILALLAYPSYTEYIRKSRRQEAIALISQIAQAQERWRGACTTYASLPNTPTAAIPNNCNTSTSGLGIPNATYYSATIASATAFGYTINAIASGAQAADLKCTRLTMEVNGGNIVYGSQGTAASSVCWSR
jgi:type IV pilus assembly protein PilE